MLTIGNSVPEFKPSGCVRCDGLRKHFNNPGVFCLRHDRKISDEERQQKGYPPYEPLPKEPT